MCKLVAFWLNRATKVVAVSSFTKKELIQLGVKSDKITIIKSCPNFVKHTDDKADLIIFRNKLAKPDEKIILFFGRLVENKGVEYLIRALKYVKEDNVKVVIVGGGPLRENLIQLAKK